MGSFWQDMRYAWRVLWREPGFTLVAVLTLALGIGVNTTIFSAVDAIVLRPLPVADPSSLVSVFNPDTDIFRQAPLSYPDYLDLRQRNTVFTDLIGYVTLSGILGRGSHIDVVQTDVVTGNYFDVLGVKARIGRTFQADDYRAGASRVAVIGSAAWQQRFAGNPNVIGQAVELTGAQYTIIGVAPAEFTGLLKGFATEFWVPIENQTILSAKERDGLKDRAYQQLETLARLKPGVRPVQALANLEAIAASLRQTYPETNKDRSISLIPLKSIAVHPEVDATVKASSAVVMVLSSLVLVIACANLANILLARALDRRKEIAVRLSLGGSRGRLIRQLLTESILLALIGGGVGLLFASWSMDFLNVVELPLPIHVALGLRLDWRVLTFTFTISVLTGIIFGLLPALQASRTIIAGALKENSAALAGSRRRSILRSGLIGAQVTLSALLLIFAGLTLRSFYNAGFINPGFDPKNVVMAQVLPIRSGYDDARGIAFMDEFVRRTRTLPGVQSVSVASNLPLMLSIRVERFALEGEERLPPAQRRLIDSADVAPGYFATMGMPLIEGRDFSETDRNRTSKLAIVNETLAKRFWPNQSSLGHKISIAEDNGSLTPMEIVGVVRDGKHRTLGEDPRPYVYGNFAQNYHGAGIVISRVTGDMQPVLSGIRSVVRSLDPDLPIMSLTSMTERMAVSFLLPRYAAMLFGTLGALAALLAAIGLYGVVAYSVSQRTHEIGIRMALGGRRSDILTLVVREGMVVTAIGLVLGLALALAIGRFLSVILYGVTSTDPLTLALVCLFMTAVTLTACVVPARRASKVDPMVALRYE
jgi:macrolide transport system ATP-binding/permease protein